MQTTLHQQRNVSTRPQTKSAKPFRKLQREPDDRSMSFQRAMGVQEHDIPADNAGNLAVDDARALLQLESEPF